VPAFVCPDFYRYRLIEVIGARRDAAPADMAMHPAKSA